MYYNSEVFSRFNKNNVKNIFLARSKFLNSSQEMFFVNFFNVFSDFKSFNSVYSDDFFFNKFYFFRELNLYDNYFLKYMSYKNIFFFYFRNNVLSVNLNNFYNKLLLRYDFYWNLINYLGSSFDTINGMKFFFLLYKELKDRYIFLSDISFEEFFSFIRSGNVFFLNDNYILVKDFVKFYKLNKRKIFYKKWSIKEFFYIVFEYFYLIYRFYNNCIKYNIDKSFYLFFKNIDSYSFLDVLYYLENIILFERSINKVREKQYLYSLSFLKPRFFFFRFFVLLKFFFLSIYFLVLYFFFFLKKFFFVNFSFKKLSFLKSGGVLNFFFNFYSLFLHFSFLNLLTRLFNKFNRLYSILSYYRIIIVGSFWTEHMIDFESF